METRHRRDCGAPPAAVGPGFGLATAALTTRPGSGSPAPDQPATAATVELARSRDDGLSIGCQPDAAMRRLGGDEPAESTRIAGADAGVEDATPEQASVRKVRAGEHFWTLVEEVRRGPGSAADGRRDRAVWRQVIEVNLDGLADPGDTDLAYPGQRFVVPAPPPAPQKRSSSEA